MTSDIDDVIRQETRRGKRPIDIETRRQHAKVVKGLSWLKEQGATDAEAAEFIVNELKLSPDDPKVLNVRKMWRDL
jgi:hypothetical protein